MRFIIEPLNDTDCRIVDIDCSDEQGRAVDELVIPSTVEQDGKTYRVKEVGKPIYYETGMNPYYGRPETVTRVPRGCCFANSATDTYKFASLRQLKKITISEGIERLNVVMGNTGSNTNERGNADFVSEVILPSTLKSIGGYAFANCPKLKTLIVPDSVEEIGKKAFSKCQSLQLFQWPKSLKRVDLSAFDSMPSPDGGYVLHIPDTIEEIKGKYDRRDSFISHCTVSAKAWPIVDKSNLCLNVENIDIPEGAKKISNTDRFHKFLKAKHVGIPSTIEEIDAEVFYEDTEVAADEATLHRIMGMPGALNGTLVESIDIPEGTTEVWVERCPKLTRLTIPDTVITIKGIKNCPLLEELNIPDSVEILSYYEWRINDGAICDTQAHITASSKIWELICNQGCLSRYYPKNKELEIPEGVTAMKSRFIDCSLTSVVFPSSINEISGGFTDCESLETITFPSSPVKYEGQTVLRCKNLKYVIFPADDPETATYPEVLGKKVDWYVPDNMVAQVKALIKEKKIDAKNAKPLSKLPGYMLTTPITEGKKPAPVKKKISSKIKNLTKPIKFIDRNACELTYVFAVTEADKKLLANEIDAAALAVFYMRSKSDECSLEIRNWGTCLEVYDGNTPLSKWECYTLAGKRKPRVPVDFNNPSAFPEDFPTDASKFSNYNAFLASRIPALGRKLPESASYLRIEVSVGMNFEFFIDAKDTFDDRKIHELEDKETGRIMPLCVMYGKRFIPSTSIVIDSLRTNLHVFQGGDFIGNAGIEPVSVEEIRIDIEGLPLLDQILNAIK